MKKILLVMALLSPLAAQAQTFALKCKSIDSNQTRYVLPITWKDNYHLIIQYKEESLTIPLVTGGDGMPFTMWRGRTQEGDYAMFELEQGSTHAEVYFRDYHLHVTCDSHKA